MNEEERFTYESSLKYYCDINNIVATSEKAECDVNREGISNSTDRKRDWNA